MAEVQSRLTDAAEMIVMLGVDGMEFAAKEIMAESLVEVPKVSGTLARSARIKAAVINPTGASIEFGYGYGDEVNEEEARVAAEYAVPVHEIIEASHRAPEKAKFLEDPIMQFIPLLGPTYKAFISAISGMPITGAQLRFGFEHDWTRDLEPMDLGFDV